MGGLGCETYTRLTGWQRFSTRSLLFEKEEEHLRQHLIDHPDDREGDSLCRRRGLVDPVEDWFFRAGGEGNFITSLADPRRGDALFG